MADQPLLQPTRQAAQAQQALIPASEGKIKYKLHTLGKDNYTIWKQHTKNILEARNLLDVVFYETDGNNAKEKQARALLTSALDSDNQMKVINCHTAYRIWKRLESIYENKTSFEAQILMNKLHSYKIANTANISKSISEIENYAANEVTYL